MGIARIASIKSTMASEQNNFAMRGVLEGHSGWVTSIATTNENPEMILSASRDKTAMVWQITGEDMKYGAPKKALRGHGHFVQDVVISSDGTLRLWDLNTGLTTRRFVGHSKDVLSVAFSADNRQIVSGRGTRPSSSGTPSASASTPSSLRARATPSGSRASLSPHRPRRPSSSPVAGISSSRCGTSLTASSAPTLLGTLATSTL